MMVEDNIHRILIIDDTPTIHDDFRKVLLFEENSQTDLEKAIFGSTTTRTHKKQKQFPTLKIDSAFQGQDGAEKIINAYRSGTPYALVFVDIRMPPGWDGIRTIMEFWKIDPDVQVIICSAYSDYSWVDIMKKFGTSDRLIILKKPFDNSEVRQLVATLTCKWSLAYKIRQQLMNLEKTVEERTLELKTALSISSATLDSTTDGILVVGENNNIINYNLQFLKMWHLTKEMVKGQDFTTLFNHLKRQLISSAAFEKVHKDSRLSSKLQAIELMREDNLIYEMVIQPYTVDGIDSGRLYCFHDITQRKHFERELTYQATHDYLTGLPSRLLIAEHLSKALVNAKKKNRLVGVVYLDLDHFKIINDNFGQAVGDALLQGVATRLQLNMRPTDALCRLGGDEFMMVFGDIKSEAELTSLISNIMKHLKKPFFLKNHEIQVSASMGISVYPKDGTESDVLLSNADTALYHLKEKSRNTYRFFDQSMIHHSRRIMEFESLLRFGILQEQFHLDYQPIIDTLTGKIVGVEALLRWHHPTLGPISPLEFISIAERSGLIGPIGEWVLNTVGQQLSQWKKKDLPEIFVAINISGVQLLQANFFESFYEIIQKLNINPHLLEFELTESVLLEKNKNTLATLQKFKEMGIRIALDDFGTGYSTISYIKHFPVDKIKVESSFVTSLNKDKDSLKIVCALITMTHNLGLKMVAEGVENEEIAQILKENKCDYLQGYLFSYPVSGDKITDLLIKQERA